MTPFEPYPSTAKDRTKWILTRRGARNAVDARRPYGSFVEDEIGPDGTLWKTATILLTNAECAFRCVMCDLWKNTLPYRTPKGAITEQIRYSLGNIGPVRQVKLYNAGSFFDNRSVPVQEYEAIAGLLRGVDRVIVESHPFFVGARTWEFMSFGDWDLEVGLGLESVHPKAYESLNKMCPLSDFARAADALIQKGAHVRTFVLCGTPFVPVSEDLEWTYKSIDHAFEFGSSVVCAIPVRAGNGSIDALETSGDYTRPALRTLEKAQLYGLALKKGRMFADDWDIERFFDCACSSIRSKNIRAMNLTQSVQSAVRCGVCEINEL